MQRDIDNERDRMREKKERMGERMWEIDRKREK